MRDLDRKFAATCGVTDYPDRIDALRVDVAVADGDVVKAGDMTFEAIALPGHTNCSMGFYLREERMLISVETLGVCDGESFHLPCFLVGYQMALDSIAKARALDVERVLLPHFGLLEHEAAKQYLDRAAPVVTETSAEILNILRAGGTEEDALAWFKDRFYHGNIREAYPIDAMVLNTSIMIRVIARELLGRE
jgi:glyoxylase-like metal-dependent hydrolase (beta-lactamase superfamily II)